MLSWKYFSEIQTFPKNYLGIKKLRLFKRSFFWKSKYFNVQPLPE